MDRDLFDPAGGLPAGFAFVPDFLGPKEEVALLEAIAALRFEAARYHQYEARRRVVHFGGSYDYDAGRLDAAAPIPGWLAPLGARIAVLMQVAPESIHHALVAEYRPGTPLGWHRDVPDFEAIGGVSLLGHARMRLRPYPHAKGDRFALDVSLPPRSAYAMRGPARWEWQHAIAATRTLRYSITFRTLRGNAGC